MVDGRPYSENRRIVIAVPQLLRAARLVGLVPFLFAFGFAIHGVGLLAHEFAGHGLAAEILACGIGGWRLTYFGHGQVVYADCNLWTAGAIELAAWAGLIVTIALGVCAVLAARHGRLSPMARLLLALAGYFFLLGQLGYVASGGFHGLYDPGDTALRLSARGFQWMVWVPGLLAYTVTAFAVSRVAVTHFDEHFAPTSRLARLGLAASTLGLAGLLYFVALRTEEDRRADIMGGVATLAGDLARERAMASYLSEVRAGATPSARRVRELEDEERPFPIDRLLLAIAAGGLAMSLARPPRPSERVATGDGPPSPPRRISPRVALAVPLAAALVGAALFGLMRM